MRSIHFFLLSVYLMLGAQPAFAEAVGEVMYFSGVLVAQKPSGTIKILAMKSEIERGDTLITSERGYAQVRFVDKQIVTLRPNSQLKIDEYHFKAKEPERDNAAMRLIKGGLRAISGLIGKRNNPDSYRLQTPNATIGIRGTHYGALLCQSDCGAAADTATLKDGLYVEVIDGAITVGNQGGNQSFAAGQYGYTPSFDAPPVVVPENPGIEFKPPPAFNAATSGDASGAGASTPQNQDCVIR